PRRVRSITAMLPSCSITCRCFFLNDTAPTAIYTLSLHDALPILDGVRSGERHGCGQRARCDAAGRHVDDLPQPAHRQAGAALPRDRKSTRLNSSHVSISYAVFCLKKKNRTTITHRLHDKYTVEQH